MSYKDPIRGVPDPYEGYRVEPVGDKKPGGNNSSDEEPPEEDGLLKSAFKSIQKGIDNVLESLGGEPTHHFEAKKTLTTLKESLEVLKKEDRSQDVNFLNSLSRNWNQAAEESMEYKNHEAGTLFKIFTKKILHYPENQPHTFGYYLTEHAGQKWVPFPYMELIQKIHLEHEKNPSSSPLTEWTRLLNDIIGLL